MKTKILNQLEILRASFWFIPALLVFGAIATATVMVAIDHSLTRFSNLFPWFLNNVSPEGARSILSTIAGSMITVAGVTFSITIVALNLASSQFGPRLLRNFMQDRKTQIALGTFVSTFIYCLLILRAIEPTGTKIFVPQLAVTFSVLLALFNVGVLISFIHHIAISIQADVVVATIGKELERNVSRIFPHVHEDTNPNLTEKISKLQKESREHQHKHKITSDHSGYLQAIDLGGILQIAREKDYLIEIPLRPGMFIVKNCVMAVIVSEQPAETTCVDDIAHAFIIGSQRTSEQDIEYSIHQLVEVAVRALSPGVNDPNTAISCLDQLGAALCFLADRHFPPATCFDDEGKLRLQIKPFTYQRIVRASFDQIRQNGIRCAAVVIHILEMLDIIAKQSCHSEQRDALYQQSNMVIRGIEEGYFEEHDKNDITDRYNRLLQTLDSFHDADIVYSSVTGFVTA